MNKSMYIICLVYLIVLSVNASCADIDENSADNFFVNKVYVVPICEEDAEMKTVGSLSSSICLDCHRYQRELSSLKELYKQKIKEKNSLVIKLSQENQQFVNRVELYQRDLKKEIEHNQQLESEKNWLKQFCCCYCCFFIAEHSA